MKLDGQQASGNVEDRRGLRIGGGLGVGAIAIAVIAYFLGFDPGAVMSVVEQVAPQQQDGREASRGAPADPPGQFVAKVLGSTELVWGGIFRQANRQYRAPTLVLYEGRVRSACGIGQAATGPFYCSDDERLYLDLTFFRDLQSRFDAPGDFAQAYVIAHEVGHHVQKLGGSMEKAAAARARAPQTEANRISVRLELQADCYAGVWGHHASAMKQLDSGDIAEALNAATAIGDDRLQNRTQGQIVPESFTHGSSAQRVSWFKRGLESGRPQDCDTLESG